MKGLLITVCIILFPCFISAQTPSASISNAFIDFAYDGWIDVYHSSEDCSPFLRIRNELAFYEDIVSVEIIESSGDRFRVNLMNEYENIWIKNVYINKEYIRILVNDIDAILYLRPDYLSDIVTTIEGGSHYRFPVIDIEGAWLKVGYIDEMGFHIEGWMPPECQMANPY